MRTSLRSALAVSACVLSCGVRDGRESVEEDDPTEVFSGGRATVFDVSTMAFAQVVPGVTRDREDEFFVGNAIFNRSWTAAPGSAAKFDGLGPLFNAASCSACHFKDGRGRPPEHPGEAFMSLLLRVSVPGVDEHGAPRPEPTYGGQIQGGAVRGLAGEGREHVTYEEIGGSFADGEPYVLARPQYVVADMANGPLAPEAMLSPRVAPAIHGGGLLESIPEATILAHADPDDGDGDGISGRANWVWNVRAEKRTLGRFGWKANQPTLEQQAAAAFNGDMGVTSSLFSVGDCTPAQAGCKAATSGGSPEVDDALLASVVTYLQLLAVPARRHEDDPAVRRGKATFLATGCASCHLPKLTTAHDAAAPELAREVIRPYTDLLLHDMGPDLADGRPDFDATGAEWRTAPLWGIGLVRTVNRHTRFLHDGRARSLAEAVLWHEGEARRARDAFLNLSRTDRDALITFLESL